MKDDTQIFVDPEYPGKEQLVEVLLDDRRYIEAFLKVRSKDGKLVPLILNDTQITVFREVMEKIRRDEPVRMVILKARQQGISTLIQALLFHWAATNFFVESLVITHEPKATANMFKMQKLFYENLPEEIKPMKRYDNATTLTFDNPSDKMRAGAPGLRSQIKVMTEAGGEVRGLTIQNLHLSEVAFWKSAEKLVLSAFQAVPHRPNTSIFIESTGNGVGGFFHDHFYNALNGKNNFTAIFLPWFSFGAYSKPVPPYFELSAEEREIKHLYRLTDEQMAWRRDCIANECLGDVRKFKQEYPATPAEAFLASGTPKFHVDNLIVYQSVAPKPLWVGMLESDNNSVSVKAPTMLSNPGGYLQIFEFPKADHTYVIGGDTSKGTVWSDNACLQVLDRETGDQVAVWHGKMDPTMFAYEAARLGYYYKGAKEAATLAIESNKDGATTNRVLRDEVRYPAIYKRRQLDTVSQKMVEALGFHTSEITRPMILNKLARWIIEGQFSLRHGPTIQECLSFHINENGRPEAREGCHDDTVIALAIAIHLHDFEPIVKKKDEDARIPRVRSVDKLNW